MPFPPPRDLPNPGIEPMSLMSLALAAAAAKSLQLCLTLCNPIDGSPPGSAIPGILQARGLEWVAIAFSLELADGFFSTSAAWEPVGEYKGRMFCLTSLCSPSPLIISSF